MPTDEPKTKTFPVNMPIELFDSFYRIFPDYGARSLFVREAVREALRQLSTEDGTLNLPNAVKIALQSPALRIRIANVRDR
jgi:metal-responsive CopG/Arc/MetJ family transcriptional regulator